MPKLKQMFREGSRYAGDFKYELVRKKKWYHRQMWRPLTPVIFVWGDDTIIINRPCKNLDGFSIPFLFETLTAGRLSNIMPGLQVSATHDKLCAEPNAQYFINGEYRALTRKERVQVFHDAAKSVEHLFPGGLEYWMYKVVRFGSRYLGYCK